MHRMDLGTSPAFWSGSQEVYVPHGGQVTLVMREGEAERPPKGGVSRTVSWEEGCGWGRGEAALGRWLVRMGHSRAQKQRLEDSLVAR